MNEKKQMAYVLINVKPEAFSTDYFSEIRKIVGEEAHRIYGVYDVIAKVEAGSRKGLKEKIQEIEGLDKVRSIMPMRVSEGWIREDNGEITEKNYKSQ